MRYATKRRRGSSKVDIPYTEQLLDYRWLQRREEILLRDKSRCVKCGSTEYLQIHHRYYRGSTFAWEYEDSALLTLCDNCHVKVHEDLAKHPRRPTTTGHRNKWHQQNYYALVHSERFYGLRDKMPYGKFKGRLLGALLRKELHYMEWLILTTDILLDDEVIIEFLVLKFPENSL